MVDRQPLAAVGPGAKGESLKVEVTRFLVLIVPFLNPYLREFSEPPNLENVRPHSRTLMKKQPHNSQFSRENATPMGKKITPSSRERLKGIIGRGHDIAFS